MTPDFSRHFLFQPRVSITVVHALLLAGVYALFMGRKPGPLQSAAIANMVPGFYSHVSNFSLSFLFLAGGGFLGVLMGVPVRQLAWSALALAVANVGYELLLPLLNTRDPVDAAYGVAGTLLAFIWVLIVRRYGVDPALR